jgi:hypothetical protein
MPKPLPKDLIISNLQYDEKSSSCLRWITNYSLRSKKGQEAGTLNLNKYWVVRLNNKLYYAHRIVMLLTKGEFNESLDIDHINGDKSLNTMENLRVVSRSTNLLNKAVTSRSKSGYKFITSDTSRGRATIRWKDSKGTMQRKIFKGLTIQDSINFAFAYREYLVEKGEIKMMQWQIEKEYK